MLVVGNEVCFVVEEFGEDFMWFLRFNFDLNFVIVLIYFFDKKFVCVVVWGKYVYIIGGCKDVEVLR